MARSTTRPTTCAALAVTSPAYAAARPDAVTCARLPQHKGDCRPTLKAPVAPRVTKPKARKVTSKGADVTKLLKAIEDGKITASEALSLLAATKSPRKSPAKARTTTKVVTKPVVWGCNVKAANGVTGKVVRISGDVTEIMLADKSRKTYVTGSLTRI